MHCIICVSHSEKIEKQINEHFKNSYICDIGKRLRNARALLQTGRAGCSWRADPNSWCLEACRSVELRTGKVQCPSRGGEGAAGGALAQHRDWSW